MVEYLLRESQSIQTFDQHIYACVGGSTSLVALIRVCLGPLRTRAVVWDPTSISPGGVANAETHPLRRAGRLRLGACARMMSRVAGAVTNIGSASRQLAAAAIAEEWADRHCRVFEVVGVLAEGKCFVQGALLGRGWKAQLLRVLDERNQGDPVQQILWYA